MNDKRMSKAFHIKTFFFVVTTFTICYIILFMSPERSKTYLQFERKLKLCNLIEDYKPMTYIPSKNRSCPRNGIVTVIQGGRLGNQIWEYAAVWLIAKETGLEPFVPSCIKATISILLDNLNIPIIEDIRSCLVENANSGPNKSRVLPKWVYSPGLLAKYINDLNKIFTIKKSLLDKGQEILLSSIKWLNLSVETYVGVHVRRTDYIQFLKDFYKIVPPNITTYIKSAMEYFEKRYPDPIFIVVSDDPFWCFQTFGSKSNVYITARYHESSPELDMAVMASCNHSIIDYGTYGQWAAIFAGGETVFYRIEKSLTSETMSRHFKHWHTLKISNVLDSHTTETIVNNSGRRL